jgi:prevent-host-death family protein
MILVMFKVNIHEVKAKLSEYLERAAAGERIVICRHNQPVAELRPLPQAHAEPRPVGPIPGRPSFDVPDAFFEPLPDEELDLWEGGAVPELPEAPRLPGGASMVAESKGSRGRERAKAAGRRRR